MGNLSLSQASNPLAYKHLVSIIQVQLMAYVSYHKNSKHHIIIID